MNTINANITSTIHVYNLCEESSTCYWTPCNAVGTFECFRRDFLGATLILQHNTLFVSSGSTNSILCTAR